MKRGWIIAIVLLVLVILFVGISFYSYYSSPLRAKPVITEDCSSEPVPGPCEALIYGFYYDKPSNKCESFVWGGCGGIRPFETLEACQLKCE